MFLASKILGVPNDEAIVGLCLITSMLLCLVLSHIHSPTARKTFSSVFGTMIMIYAYGAGSMLLIPFNMLGYFFMNVLPRDKQHTFVMIFCGAMLTAFNMNAYLNDDLGYNASVLAMITYVKQYIIATNYRDGKGDIDNWLTSREKKYALKKMPTFMEYYHYMHALSTCVVGPPFEYGDWKAFIQREGTYAKIRPFSNYIPAFTKLLQGFVCIAISNTISMNFDLF